MLVGQMFSRICYAKQEIFEWLDRGTNTAIQWVFHSSDSWRPVCVKRIPAFS